MTPRTDTKKARGVDATSWEVAQILAWACQLDNGMEFVTLTRNQILMLRERIQREAKP